MSQPTEIRETNGSGGNREFQLALTLYKALREEIVSLQRIRNQLVVLKVGIVSAVLGALSWSASAGFTTETWPPTDPTALLLLSVVAACPALVAMLFDLVIAGTTHAIKRDGQYVRHVLEPRLIQLADCSKTLMPWETYLLTIRSPWYAALGDRGLTLVTFLLSCGALAAMLIEGASATLAWRGMLPPSLLLGVLLVLLGIDLWMNVKAYGPTLTAPDWIRNKR